MTVHDSGAVFSSFPTTQALQGTLPVQSAAAGTPLARPLMPRLDMANPSASSVVQGAPISPNFVPSLRLPQHAATGAVLAESVTVPAAPQDIADAVSVDNIHAPRSPSETETRPSLEVRRQQQPLQRAVPPRRYFVFTMLKKNLDEKLGICFQEADAVDGGMEVKQINDTAGDASEILLAARWNEDIMTTFPENRLQPGDVAYMLHDGTSFNKDAISSVLPNTLDIWIVFYRNEVEQAERC